MPDDLWQGVAARIQSTPRRAPFGWWWKPAAGFGVAAAILLGVLFTRMESPSLPVAEASAGSYVTDHQFLSAGDPFTDRAGLGVMLAAQRGETP